MAEQYEFSFTSLWDNGSKGNEICHDRNFILSAVIFYFRILQRIVSLFVRIK